RGEVLPIGGLNEKLLAALRSGIKNVLIPFDNQKNLPDVPQEIIDELNIIPIKTADEAIENVFGKKNIGYKKKSGRK
ncbi:endopeptidase La, partial [Candidatus Saccharibacteria bacterium]|nr:endopeptidase La [Candidatus Saccharibacteria bacterium]